MPSRRQLRQTCRIENISAAENLWRAALKARKHKTRRPDVEAWWLRRESALNRLSQELSAGDWRPAGYRFFEIHEPKRRTIAAARRGTGGKVVGGFWAQLVMRMGWKGSLQLFQPGAISRTTVGAETSLAAATNRVLRGGSWNNDNEINLRSSNRNNNTPTNRNNNIGLRCVLEFGGGGKASDVLKCIRRKVLPVAGRQGASRSVRPRPGIEWTPNPSRLAPGANGRHLPPPGKRRGGRGGCVTADRLQALGERRSPRLWRDARKGDFAKKNSTPEGGKEGILRLRR